jgi:HAD superfamily hydrolase (TIGR01509 family)
MARFDLVIFDCDGVVVDSERIAHEVFGQFIRSLGASMSDEEMQHHFLGRRLAECVAIVEGLTGRPAPPGALDAYKKERDRVLREHVQPIPGVREVLEGLRVPYCLASSGDFDKMRVTLGATKLWSFFEGRIYSATQVPNGKPAPDIFLFAAKQMGFDPARTAVIEDSVNGVLAGVAAGMTTFGFAGLLPAAKLLEAGAAATFTHMRELPGLLA